MAEGKDKYGIPVGGNSGPYVARRWKGIRYTLPWKEVLAGIALAGWPKDKWGLAAAVCAAESSRNPFIYNTYKKGHFGLFQISRAAWPEFFDESKDGGMQWVSPVYNPRKAYEIYKVQGWKAWEGYTSGRYLTYLPAAYEAAADFERLTGLHGGDEKGYWQSLFSQKTAGYLVKALEGGDLGANIGDVATSGLGEAIAGAANGTAAGVVDSGAAVASAVNDTFGWLPDLWTAITTPAFWMRVGYGALGVVLVGGGLFLIVRQRPAVQAAAKTVSGAVPGGAVLKSVGGKAA